MKRIAVFFGLAVLLGAPSWLIAQESVGATHGEVGVYADYFRFSPGSGNATNFVGAGGRAAYRFHFMAMEAEMNYDFARNFTSTYTNNSGTTTTTTFVKSSVRPLTGLFGPVFYAGTGRMRAFATGKVGFVDFSVNNSGVVSQSTFTNSVAGVGGSGTHIAVYPGAGLEGYFGPFGLRLEAGDEVYVNNGAYNNLRVTLGPELRF
ncbi:MAG: hypothetical protein WB524_01860 [Acidobacteriaceae bacterium]|jgi:hypothetical protein